MEISMPSLADRTPLPAHPTDGAIRTSHHSSVISHIRVLVYATLLGAFPHAVLSQGWAESMAAACFTDTCMALGLSGEAEEALRSDNGTDATLIAGQLQYWFSGETPMPALLVASRYRDGRLVRYATSNRIMLTESGTATAVHDSSDAIGRAFRPVAEPRVTLSAATQRFPALSVPVALTSLVGHLPPTSLIDAGAGSLLIDAAEDQHDELRRGEYGVIVLVPQSTEQRAADLTQAFGLLIRLDAR
jgi:hypothetical protein